MWGGGESTKVLFVLLGQSHTFSAAHGGDTQTKRTCPVTCPGDMSLYAECVDLECDASDAVDDKTRRRERKSSGKK
jgi:hypothetical protein